MADRELAVTDAQISKAGCRKDLRSSTSTDGLKAVDTVYLEMSTFTEQQSPVPLLLGYQIINQPHLCQADKVREPIELGHFCYPVGTKMQKLEACETRQVSQAPQPVVSEVQSAKPRHAGKTARV